MFNAWPVVAMIISGRTVARIIFALGVGKDHMLHTCAEHQQRIMSAYTVAAHIIPWETAPVSPTTTEKSLGLHHGIFTVKDLTMEQILKIWDCHKEFQQIP